MNEQTEKITQKGNVYKLKSDSGYIESGRNLAKMTDTGNGYIFKFYSWSSCYQDNYVCLDYSEASYALKLMIKAAMIDEDTVAEIKEMLNE